MSKIFDILTIVGARPQFVKAATLSRAFSKHGQFSERIVHTGQHFDANMSDNFFAELSIPAPAYNLHISGGGHGRMTGRMLEGIEALLTDARPDAVLVYGDTNSTLAGAIAAAKMHIPVVHVEAGLRSFNRLMPEEINRVLADHISTLLLCPSSKSIKNLATEGITQNVHHVGDVMYDATLYAKKHASTKSSVVNALNLEPGAYAIATVHRAENTDCYENLKRVVTVLKEQADICDVVLPLHPRTKAALTRHGLNLNGIITTDPVGYLDMQQLLSEASLVITDSGGLQKEAYFHRVPCLTLRSETEWVETVDCGWNRLWDQPQYAPQKIIEEYGNGTASTICADIIYNYLKHLKP
ncbi:UDP-N-acetylglucosamine 2-epimerase (non-hydrolyzing) [Ahrensia kielensis]|uniref:UDP-N-acetylglucosamine 2-epimerase (Non-hydrolyzing) n=1 Tax=Ahrensia kielensis TaxID=76980 RepID=A0ABU9T7Z2_9HYPH